jgi:hypothetical protein
VICSWLKRLRSCDVFSKLYHIQKLTLFFFRLTKLSSQKLVIFPQVVTDTFGTVYRPYESPEIRTCQFADETTPDSFHRSADYDHKCQQTKTKLSRRLLV